MRVNGLTYTPSIGRFSITTAVALFVVAALGTPVAAASTEATPVITEIMQNPDQTRDFRGEWFEVHNPGSKAINLKGWTIRDNGRDSHVIARKVIVDAGGYVVLVRRNNPARNGGVHADYVYRNALNLFNGSDQLELVAPNGTIADRVAWDNGATFPDPTGASMSLRDPSLDNADGTNWCTATTAFGAGDLGTPGAANDCGSVSTSPNLVISEIHQNPFAVSDVYGEWFEVSNPTDVDVDMNGWVIRDDIADSHTIDANGGLIVPAGGSVVIGRSLDQTRNGGVAVDYSAAGALHLYNDVDQLELVDVTGRVVDRVAWTHGIDGWDVRNGAAMALQDLTADNDTAASWCVSGPQYGAGDQGTPGAAASCANEASSSVLVVSEIMVNPRSVADSKGEWFELHNPGNAEIDINGWTLRDNGFDVHVIDNGAPLVVPAGGYLVLGRNSDESLNGGVAVAYAYGSDLTMMNTIDELEILDGSLRSIDRVAWDDGLTFPDQSGASLALIDTSADNTGGSNWCASAATFGSGDQGTPGAANDC